MRTIVVDDVIAQWIDIVKQERGRVGVDHGKDVMCDDENAIVEMYSAWVTLKKVKAAMGR